MANIRIARCYKKNYLTSQFYAKRRFERGAHQSDSHIAVIPAGVNSTYGHLPQVLVKLAAVNATVLKTDLQGANNRY